MATSPKVSTGTFHIWFQIPFAALCLYWYFHLPGSGKCVMVLAGVAVLMTVHDMSKRDKLIWLLVVFALMFLENKSIDKDRSDASNRDTVLIKSANSLVTQVGFLVPQVTLTNTELGNLKDQLNSALKSNDKERAAELRRKVDAAQERADDASLRLLLTMAPGVVSEMRTWSVKFTDDDTYLFKQANGAKTKIDPTNDSDGYGRISREFAQKRANLAQSYAVQIRPIMTTANYLREELLRGSPQTQDDKDAAAIFARSVAGEPINWMEMEKATGYLAALVKKSTQQTQSAAAQ